MSSRKSGTNLRVRYRHRNIENNYETNIISRDWCSHLCHNEFALSNAWMVAAGNVLAPLKTPEDQTHTCSQRKHNERLCLNAAAESCWRRKRAYGFSGEF